MLKWLRAHNKQILAILGVFLMVAFIIPPASKRGGWLGGRGQSIGTIGARKINPDELDEAQAEWKVLNTLYPSRPDLEWAREVSARGCDAMCYLLLVTEAQRMNVHPNVQYAEQVAKDIRDAAEQTLKAGVDRQKEAEQLLKAANASGKTQDISQANQALVEATNMVATSQTTIGYATSSAFLQGMVNWHMVIEGMETRILGPSQFSPVVAEYNAISQKQQVSLGIIPFKADEFRSLFADSTTQPATRPTTQPTESELAEFFDKYKDKDSGNGDFGFGYRYPKRLSLQYLMVPKDAIIARLAIDTDIYNAYLDDPGRFIRRPEMPEEETSPTTEPSTQPASATTMAAATTAPASRPALAKAATRPTTQPRQFAFNELTVSDLDMLRDQLADQGAEDLARQLYKKMSDQYNKYHSDPKAAPETDLGVRYDSSEYFQRLAASFAKPSDKANSWHDVRPLVSQRQIEEWLRLDRVLHLNWLTEAAAQVLGSFDWTGKSESTRLVPLGDLSELPGLGAVPTVNMFSAFYRPFLDQRQQQELNQALMQRQQALQQMKQAPMLAQFYKPRLPQVSSPLELWQPSEPIHDSLGNYYIYRIVQAEVETVPAKYADYTDKEKVRADYIVFKSYELAKAKAEQCLKVLKVSVVENKSTEINPLVSAAVDCGRKAPDWTDLFTNETAVSPKQFPLSSQGSEQFRKGAFDLLSEKLKTGNPNPIGLIEVQYDKCLVVAQLSKSEGGAVDYKNLPSSMLQLNGFVIRAAVSQWFDPDSIKKRMSFTPGADYKPRE